MAELIEVRILGGLHVRRSDGSVVAHRNWRTSKTRDLLRLLALHGGQPVSVDRLVEALWPEADEDKARASLRTAASQIRRVLGEQCVERQLGGLVLQRVWVDVAAFESLTADAHRAFAREDLPAGMEAAREAAGLYTGELCADEPYAEWATVDRERLRLLHQGLLVEAADAALGLDRLREAVHLAEQALELEACSERCHRVLMRAYFRLGETEQSLRVYERCRETLAEELGADPAPETQALHLEILSAENDTVEAPPLVGRDRDLGIITSAVQRALREGYSALVALTGLPGVGLSRVADEAARYSDARVVTVSCQPGDADGHLVTFQRLVATLTGAAADGPRQDATAMLAAARQALSSSPTVVVMDDLHRADRQSVAALRELVAGLDTGVAVVATLGGAAVGSPVREAIAELAGRGRAVTHRLEALTRTELATLLGHALHGQPTAALVEEVADGTDGLPGAALAMVRQLASAGQLTATHAGVERRSQDVTAAPAAVESTLRRARAMLSAEDEAVLDIVAVLGGSFTAESLDRLSDECDRERIHAALTTLADLTVLVHDGQAYRFRNASVHDVAYQWLRPSVRRQLHDRIARTAVIAEAARVEHWLAAGEPRLACAASLQAADEAMASGDRQEAHRHLLRAQSLTDRTEATAEDQIGLLESLGDACLALGRTGEAREALSKAVQLARRHAPCDLARLCRKRGTTETTSDEGALSWYHEALAITDNPPRERVRTNTAIGAMLVQRSPAAAEDALRNAVDMADKVGDAATQVEARCLLAGQALAARRRFDDGRRWSEDAVKLADAYGQDALLARAVFAGKEIHVCLGGAQRAISPLQRAADLAASARLSDLHEDIELPLALVHHDLGSPDFTPAWARTAPRVKGRLAKRAWSWIPLRILYERGDLQAAATLSNAALAAASDAVGYQQLGDVGEAEAVLVPLEHLARQRQHRSTLVNVGRVRGGLAAARGRTDEAESAFRTALDRSADLHMPFDRALLEQAYGLFLRQHGERRAATTLLRVADDRFTQLGARPYAERCEQALAGHRPSSGKRRARRSTDLTPQEHAVAHLVASGLTNREVAAELVLSVKTVEYHLGNIYSKIGVSSRSQLLLHLRNTPSSAEPR